MTIQVYNDVLNSIDLVHQAGVLHTDIRHSNYLYFDKFKSHQLIDFDLSLIISDKGENCNLVELQYNSGQAKAVN